MFCWCRFFPQPWGTIFRLCSPAVSSVSSTGLVPRIIIRDYQLMTTEWNRNEILTHKGRLSIQPALEYLSWSHFGKLDSSCVPPHCHTSIDQVGGAEGGVRADLKPPPLYHPVLFAVGGSHPQHIPPWSEISE